MKAITQALADVDDLASPDIERGIEGTGLFGEGVEQAEPAQDIDLLPAELFDAEFVGFIYDGQTFNFIDVPGQNQTIAWGLNNANQTKVPSGLTNVVAIAAGETFSQALRSDGTVIEWGADLAPSGLTNVVAIAAGRFPRLALKSDGTVVQWGGSTAPAGERSTRP